MTVTVTVRVSEPHPFVAVIVYVVVADGRTYVEPFAATGPISGVMVIDVAPDVVQESRESSFRDLEIVIGFAVKVVTVAAVPLIGTVAFPDETHVPLVTVTESPTLPDAPEVYEMLEPVVLPLMTPPVMDQANVAPGVLATEADPVAFAQIVAGAVMTAGAGVSTVMPTAADADELQPFASVTVTEYDPVVVAV